MTGEDLTFSSSEVGKKNERNESGRIIIFRFTQLKRIKEQHNGGLYFRIKSEGRFEYYQVVYGRKGKKK